ncbi:MAG: NADP-dependent oxidoreductase [Geminicoccaceae bacterium]|nr:NADP-dependent oxidoreductase [Geminicoccaceae bacterium]
MKRIRQWRLKSHPQGMPVPDDWELCEVEAPVLRPGTVRARALLHDVAPYMRGRISGRANYAAGVAPGDVMVGGAIAVVEESTLDGFRPGDLIVSDFGFGWQEQAVLAPADFRRVDLGIGPIECWLDVLGLNGVTAYFGLLHRGEMKAGDRVVVSAAAGSVGQLVGQIAALAGGTPVALTSTGRKLAFCREIGFADGIAYREVGNVADALKELCPNGVDVFFDNSAGPLHDAVMRNLAFGARIVICGQVSLAGRFEEPDTGERFLRQIMIARANVCGFLAIDYADRYDEARRRLGQWLSEGRIRTRYDIVDGFEKLPQALIGLFHSDNVGKRLVRTGDL